MPDSDGRFEMRRFEALSNTIFGVAMTLLAYNFPKGDALNGSPIWSTIWTTYQAQIVALLISFVVAGMHPDRVRWNVGQEAVLRPIR
jgi:uncharacterized membrane protein